MKHKSNKRTKEITPAFLKYVGGGGGRKVNRVIVMATLGQY